MRFVSEIKNSEAMNHFIAHPRFLLGTLILCAGVTLLVAEGAKLLYR